MKTLHEWRALAGWPAKGWKANSAGHGEALLRAIRLELTFAEVLDAVKATVWSDSLVDPSRGKEEAKLANGVHANLNRIFGPTKAGKRQRCVERWIEAGRPEPSPTRTASRPKGIIGSSFQRGKRA